MLLCIALRSRAIQSCILTNKAAHSTVLTHSTQYTVNPLIAPDVNPFLPSVISTVSVLFISTDNCISVTGDVSGS
ncbi:unnamed protein product [Staurois parvus]|uniref:Secreted protein n=1 Tax=Staurois parvus TaxID=386267 RepID=A0ABN9EIQ5_9NEOB|nr:unnamed protein product [Staurois parvus]